MAVRICGLLLLAISAFAVHQLNALVRALPRHPATLAELLLSLVAILAGMSGTAVLAVGPALFRTYVWPPADRRGR